MLKKFFGVMIVLLAGVGILLADDADDDDDNDGDDDGEHRVCGWCGWVGPGETASEASFACGFARS